MIDSAFHTLRVVGNASSLLFLDALEHVEVDAVRVIDPAAGVAGGDDFRTEFARFFDGVDRHIARSADRYRLAPHGVAVRIEGLLAQIHKPVPRRFLSHKTAAVGKTFAGEHADILVADALVLPHEEAYLAAAHADVARGYVRVRADVAEHLRHETLTEAHDLAVALAFGIEVAAALRAAYGEPGKAVLEDLLETEEFHHRQIDGGVEPQTALVRTYRAVELHAVAFVDAHSALVVHPRHAEHEHAFRFHEPLQQPGLLVDGIVVHDDFQAFQHFGDRLMELGFAGIVRFHLRKHFLCIRSHVIPPNIVYLRGHARRICKL